MNTDLLIDLDISLYKYYSEIMGNCDKSALFGANFLSTDFTVENDEDSVTIFTNNKPINVVIYDIHGDGAEIRNIVFTKSDIVIDKYMYRKEGCIKLIMGDAIYRFDTKLPIYVDYSYYEYDNTELSPDHILININK